MVNWGIIGLGRIANEFASGFNGLKNANLLSVASKTQKKLDEFKNKFSIKEKYCFSNYEDLIACDEIDIVYIALPHNLHFQWIMKCLENNKKVLSEINEGDIYHWCDVGCHFNINGKNKLWQYVDLCNKKNALTFQYRLPEWKNFKGYKYQEYFEYQFTKGDVWRFMKIKNDSKFIKSENLLIIISLIASSYVLIAHQLMTLNGMFIFFIIPISQHHIFAFNQNFSIISNFYFIT